MIIISVSGSSISSAVKVTKSIGSSSLRGEHIFDGMKVDGAWILAITSSADNVLTQLKQAHFPKVQTMFSNIPVRCGKLNLVLYSSLRNPC